MEELQRYLEFEIMVTKCISLKQSDRKKLLNVAFIEGHISPRKGPRSKFRISMEIQAQLSKCPPPNSNKQLPFGGL